MPQLALSYRLSGEIEIAAGVGHTVQTPTLNDLYYKLYGNPHLQPDVADQYQVTASYAPISLLFHPSLSITYFRSRINDEIVWEPDTGGTEAWYPINVGVAALHGFEIRATATLNLSSKMSIDFDESYTILSAHNENVNDPYFGKELIYSTPTTSLLSASMHHLDFGTLALLAHYRGHKFTDAANTFGNELQPVTTLGVCYTSPMLSIFGLIVHGQISSDNITDQSYQEAFGYPLPGRSYKISIQLQY
jgi:vitamin B12 transporter